MFSLQDGIKYIGLAAILYFLIKAFAGNYIDNKQIAILVLIIMALVIFLLSISTDCPKNINKIIAREHYQITDPPIVNSIYPGPDNTEYRTDTLLPPPPNIMEKDADIQDFKDILPIDKQVYERLIKKEKKAKKKLGIIIVTKWFIPLQIHSILFRSEPNYMVILIYHPKIGLGLMNDHQYVLLIKDVQFVQ